MLRKTDAADPPETPRGQRVVLRRHCPHVGFAEVHGAEHHVAPDNPPGFVWVVSTFLANS